MKVIIIEDDSAVRESLLLLLRQLDFQPVAYASAEAFIDAEPPDCGDVLLVDIELPGMSGAELIELVRKQPRPPRMVLMTGKPQSTLDRVQQAIGPIQVLRKPLDIERLARVLTH